MAESKDVKEIQVRRTELMKLIDTDAGNNEYNKAELKRLTEEMYANTNVQTAIIDEDVPTSQDEAEKFAIKESEIEKPKEPKIKASPAGDPSKRKIVPNLDKLKENAAKAKAEAFKARNDLKNAKILIWEQTQRERKERADIKKAKETAIKAEMIVIYSRLKTFTPNDVRKIFKSIRNMIEKPKKKVKKSES